MGIQRATVRGRIILRVFVDRRLWTDAQSPAARRRAAPVVTDVFLDAPVVATPQRRLGPRLIFLDRRAFTRPRGALPLVIYGDAQD